MYNFEFKKKKKKAKKPSNQSGKTPSRLSGSSAAIVKHQEFATII